MAEDRIPPRPHRKPRNPSMAEREGWKGREQRQVACGLAGLWKLGPPGVRRPLEPFLQRLRLEPSISLTRIRDAGTMATVRWLRCASIAAWQIPSSTLGQAPACPPG